MTARLIATLCFEIERLPARHAAKARCARQARDKVKAHRRIRMDFWSAHDIEGQGQKRVACQNRHCVIIDFVNGGASAPQIIIVHCGQIVMDEGIAVDELKRRAGEKRGLRIGAAKTRTFDEQKRSQPLAAAERAMAHRRQEAGGAGGFPGKGGLLEQTIEQGFDRDAGLVELRLEEICRVTHWIDPKREGFRASGLPDGGIGVKRSAKMVQIFASNGLILSSQVGWFSV